MLLSERQGASRRLSIRSAPAARTLPLTKPQIWPRGVELTVCCAAGEPDANGWRLILRGVFAR